MPFIENNWQLIMAITGAAIALGVTFTEKLAKRKNTRVLLILAVFGFLIYTVQQLMQTELDNNRELLIIDIKKTVHGTHDIVVGLADSLKGRALAELGEELFTINDDPDAAPNVQLEAIDKTSVDKWRRYAHWVDATKRREGVVPCLSLTLNARHRYMVELVLAFLLTDAKTQGAIGDALLSHDLSRWRAFPDDDFVKQYGLKPQSLGYVLFFDGGPDKLIAYASAEELVEELYIKKIMGWAKKIENELNKKQDNAKEALKELFSSVSTSVETTADIPDIVKMMIKEDVAEVTVWEDRKKYLVKLQHLIKLAKEGVGPVSLD